MIPSLRRLVKGILGSLLLSACHSSPSIEDVTVATSATPSLSAAAAFLGTSLHLSRPVVVVQEPEMLDHGIYGKTQLADGKLVYVISIEQSLDDHAARMVLLHEMAHVLVWDGGSWYSGHGTEWGEAYSQVFQVWVGESVQEE
jgi:hypothetical protein